VKRQLHSFRGEIDRSIHAGAALLRVLRRSERLERRIDRRTTQVAVQPSLDMF